MEQPNISIMDVISEFDIKKILRLLPMMNSAATLDLVYLVKRLNEDTTQEVKVETITLITLFLLLLLTITVLCSNKEELI